MLSKASAIGLLAALLFASAPAAEAEPCSRAQNCEFWDNNYHMYILNDWPETSLDILIVPPASPYVLRDIGTMEASVDMWIDGINNMGASWLTDNLEINRYTIGQDIVPAQAMADPEIIIFSGEYNPFLLFGIGLANPLSFCANGINPWDTTSQHQHEDSQWLFQNVRCDMYGQQCYVVNTNFLLGGQRRMFDLNSHELGHCLGIGHVGDALDFDAKRYPSSDIMSYQYNPSQVHCVSNLNMVGIHGVHARTLGRPSGEWLDSGDYVTMSPGAYSQPGCANPTGGILG